MYCSKCGAVLKDDDNFCTSCGTPVLKAPNMSNNPETPAKKKDSNKKAIIIAAVCVAFVIVCGLIISQVGKASLKKELMRDWSRVESNDGSYYTLELDFSEDEIEYDFNSSYFDKNIYTYEYKVVSRNKIKIEDYDEVFEIEFNDDKTMMIVTPAITSSDSSENWFNFE